MLFLVVCYLWADESPRWSLSRGDNEGACQVFERIRASNRAENAPKEGENVSPAVKRLWDENVRIIDILEEDVTAGDLGRIMGEMIL